MKRVYALVLALLMAMSGVVLASAQEAKKLPYEAIAEFSDKATVLISSEEFATASKDSIGMVKWINVSDGMIFASQTLDESESVTFTKAVKYSCVTPPATWIGTGIRFDFDPNSELCKSLKKGDTLLLKYVAKGLEGDCELSIRFWNSADQSYNLINQSSRMKLSDDWTAYYYPVTITDDTLIPNQIIFRTNNTEQTMLIGGFELVSYGSAVTKDQLATALKNAGAKENADTICPYYSCEPEYKPVVEEDDDEGKLPHEAIAKFSDKASTLIASTEFATASKDSMAMVKWIDISSGMTFTPYTLDESENVTFTKAVKYSCVTPPATWIGTGIRFDFDTTSAPYKTLKKGDTLLLKIVTKGIEGSCQLSVRLWNSANQSYNLINQGSRMNISDSWTAYYFPMTITDDTLIPNQLIFKTNNTEQSMLLGDFELISYGSAVTKEQLATALTDAGATEIADATCPYYSCEPEYKPTADDGEGDGEGTEMTMITPASFIADAKATGSNGTVTTATISEADATAFGLGFTDTIKATCNTASSLKSFGVTCNVASDAVATKNGDVVLLTFYARAKNANTKVQASIVSKSGAVLKNVAGQNNDATEYFYYVPTQWTKFCLPVTVSDEVGGIRLYMGALASEVEFGGVKLETFEEGTDAFELPNGYFLCEPYTRLVLDYDVENYLDRNKVQACADIEICGDYIYAIGKGGLYILSVETGKVVGSVTGMGETRQLAVSEDGNTVVVTCRVDGGFVIAADDKTNPQIVGRCDSVEYATGVAIANGFCYITNRMFGTEVIDLRDRTLPKNVANIRTGEAQSCEIVGTTLFAGCWGGRKVEAWDVSNPANPLPLNTNIPAHGQGDGLCVMDNYLYIATGHMETGQASRSAYNVGFGLGNGMDIYDISDIKNPVFLSTVRIDDHFYAVGQDFWTVKVAKHGDKKYAYLTNTYNGVYIYDVTDPKAPVRHAVIELTATAEKYASKQTALANTFGHTSASGKKYFPYNTYERYNSPIGGLAVLDGEIYLAGASMGVAKITSEQIGNYLFEENRELGTGAPSAPEGNFYELDIDTLEDAGFEEIKYALPGGQVYSVDEKNGLVYAACGNQGVKILDTDLNVIREYAPEGINIVSEAIVHGDRLYTAEGLGGIAIYEISKDGLGLREISRYNPKTGIKFIRVSPDGNYVLCDSGSSHSELADFTDLANPKRWNGEGAYNNGWNPHNGLMYFRQLSTDLIGGRYLCSYGYSKQVYWYDFGTNPEKSEPKLIYMIPANNAGMHGGFGALTGKNSKYAITVTDNSAFCVYNPAECDENTVYANLTQHKITNIPSGVTVRGKPTIYGDIMILAERVLGDVYVVDISGLDVDAGKFEAKYITHFNFTGNPDIAKVFGSRMVFPLGNQGIVSMSIDGLSENYSTTVSLRTARAEETAPSSSKQGKASLVNSKGETVAVFYEKASDSNVLEYTAYVPKGEYELVYEKQGYLTYRETVNVDGVTELTEIVLIPGDIPDDENKETGDGIIDIDDIIRVLRGFNGSMSESIRNITDLNEDGVVNVMDLMLVIRGMKLAS
ncbi:MAG: hypothetical protein IKU43_01385 [Clostridia bacterium]|nr:hypothetical protein [Clostridia bacterium]